LYGFSDKMNLLYFCQHFRRNTCILQWILYSVHTNTVTNETCHHFTKTFVFCVNLSWQSAARDARSALDTVSNTRVQLPVAIRSRLLYIRFDRVWYIKHSSSIACCYVLAAKCPSKRDPYYSVVSGHKSRNAIGFSSRGFAAWVENWADRYPCPIDGLAVTGFAAWRVDVSHTVGVRSNYLRWKIIKQLLRSRSDVNK